MLGQVHQSRVLDLFAGSGALGIEALSRGATHAVFVERDTDALAVLQANIAGLGLTSSQAQIRRGDALATLRRAHKRGETYDLLFIDPPYRDAQDWERELSVALPPLLAPSARVVLESDRRAPIELSLELERERRYGDTLIRIHRQS